MTMRELNLPITEDELHAYVDGELPDDRCANVEAWLKSHPDDAARVAAWRAMAETLQRRYGGVVDEAVPKRLEIEKIIGRPQRWIWGAVAAALVAFIAGGAIGWTMHGVAAGPSAFASFTEDALDAHRLYVVEVRHPVEVAGSERDHLQQWLSKRVGYAVSPPQLDKAGLKLVGGRLLPGPDGPAAFFMYEGPTGERFTVYSSRAKTADMQMRYVAKRNDATMFWSDAGIGYALCGPADRDRLQQVASVLYDQVEKADVKAK
jgi:anti-sigma factor RsiW